MTRWYPLDAADDDFLDTARFRFEHTTEIAAPPDRVWETLTADDALTSWTNLITGAEWTSPRPFGVGTTRTVTLAHGAAALRERFYRWEEGHRMTFSAEAASRPGFRRFAEDVTIEPHADGTRLTWVFAADAAAWFAPLLEISRPVLSRVTAGWTHGAGRRAGRGVRP
ncbi:SRPBCC family protein [Amycolatopsis cynarae]|uniref:SRPBCC family protein n=1 Tax=Amycolatopsis cynarae TaxID=2995223 RepID=A0ABY7B8U6_9PSEU|nr:SRPBCC family protein [Amycolatopsis sp. HUAS 11-8]WAL68375.1 SRPBCC family protein [Amycolatopsis sp. HUAS 11-8]